jgi:sialate O-acetylesterase
MRSESAPAVRTPLAVLAAWLVLAPAAAVGEVRLPAVIGSNMVLQRGMKVPIWGWAGPGEKVTVALGKQTRSAEAGTDGKWQLHLDAMKAGGPFEMTVSGENTITLTNVLVGEVWVGSGQANMEMSVGGCLNAPKEIASANYPKIRLFTVKKKAAAKPQADAAASGWVPCAPRTVGGFSAAAYFFGRHLHRELGVPIGLIHTSWGGTPVESWTSRPALEGQESFRKRLEETDRAIANYPQAIVAYRKKVAEWQKQMAELKAKLQAGGDTQGWPGPDLDTKGWKPMKLPQHWESAGLNIDGCVWFRKPVDLPDSWAGKDLSLTLGPIDDDDVTYFNGEKIGQTKLWTTPRKYTVPSKLVRAGRNVLAVRVYDGRGGGGICGKPEQMALALAADGDKKISLAGEWLYRVELALLPRPGAPFGPENPWLPAGLYNGMIHPLIPYAMRGAIWYQGEANAGRAYQYRKLFPAMITDWRKNWQQGDFPFLFVQLANFLPAPVEPGDSTWAELREAQLMTLSLPATGMAVIIDIGDAKDIHPKNKQDVGKRLALAARGTVYGQRIVYSGPIYRSMKVEGGKIRLRFDHVGGGLVARGPDAPKLKRFAIAGADRKFVWADARIDGEAVVVWSDKVAEPVAVRYAWAENPEGCNLYNAEGLPASPFRTDDWPGVTAGKN